jgi:hypothetical protein
MVESPNFQRGDKGRQRAFAERATLCCCWDRRRAIELLRKVVGDRTCASAKLVEEATIQKCIEFLEELDQ